MSNWYDNITDDQIQEMKDNLVSMEMLSRYDPALASRFIAVDTGDLQGFNSVEWENIPSALSSDSIMTYRLRPDWERPARKKTRTSIGIASNYGIGVKLDHMLFDLNSPHLKKYEITITEV